MSVLEAVTDFMVLQSPVFGISESESHSVVSCSSPPDGLYSPWNSPGQKTGVGRLSFLQGIFPAQGSNPGLPHFRHILSQLGHKETYKIGENIPNQTSHLVENSFSPL